MLQQSRELAPDIAEGQLCDKQECKLVPDYQ
jgi:hypothetical protein